MGDRRYFDHEQWPMLQRSWRVVRADHARQRAGLDLVLTPEVNPPALFAHRRNGKLVEVADMIEGARNQLFLACRI